MRNSLLTVMFLLTSIAMYSQPPIQKGQSQFNAGLGFSSWGVPVYLGLDHGIHRDVTMGGELSFRSYNERFGPNRYNHSVVGLSGNVNYHFNTILKIPSNWNFYAGLNVGFYFWNSPNNYKGRNASGLGLGLQVGGRYYFTERVGVNLEIGGGNVFSNGKIGISIKL